MKKRKSYNLRIPGPTPLPAKVLEATAQQMINHRGYEYEDIQARVTKNLQYFFGTKSDVFLLTSSGMGGLEAAIANFFSPSDTIVALTIGEFGNRWAEVARRYQANVIQVKFPPGKSIDKDEARRVLFKVKNIDGVLITHNETATGVMNNLFDLAPAVKSHESKPLLLVDSISALGAVALPMDQLGIDVLVTASQKGWMAPPGLAMIAISKKAWEKHMKAKIPRYYFDLSMYRDFLLKNQTPATPAIGVIFGLDASLSLMKKEGKKKIYKRHVKLTRYLRMGIRKLNLKLLVSDQDASLTVTSIKIPNDIDGKAWLKTLRDKYGVDLAGGMGETNGKIIRVAHMGYVSKQDIEGVLKALEMSLADLRNVSRKIHL